MAILRDGGSNYYSLYTCVHFKKSQIHDQSGLGGEFVFNCDHVTYVVLFIIRECQQMSLKYCLRKLKNEKFYEATV